MGLLLFFSYFLAGCRSFVLRQLFCVGVLRD